MNDYPKILYKIQKTVSDAYENGDIKITNETNDPRENSRKDGNIIAKYLRRKFAGKIVVLNSETSWVDFIATYDNKKYPINIKSTTSLNKNNSNADNICKPASLIYALTKEETEFWEDENKLSYKKVLKILKEYKGDSGRDYYFLVVNKKRPNHVIINSLKCLENIRTNAHKNNFPFQVDWSKNTKPCHNRNFDESYELLVRKFEKSIELYNKPKQKTSPPLSSDSNTFELNELRHNNILSPHQDSMPNMSNTKMLVY